MMSRLESARCIYCGSPFDNARGEGDHVVPAALGEFANLRRFRGMCLGCNNDIGKSEAQLLRCGPEAFMARVAIPPQRRGGEGKAWSGAMGAPPPEMFTHRHGAKLIVRPIMGDPLNRELVDCIDVIDQHGNHHPIQIFKGMSAVSIRQRIKALRIDGRFNVHFSVSAENGAWFDGIADELWPDADRTEFPMTDVGCSPGWGSVAFSMHDHYFRALAKMAFHWYLCYNKSGVRGDEPEFAALRQFILDGGDPAPFFPAPHESPVYFGVPFGEDLGGGVVSSSQWCHLLAADDTQNWIIVCLHMFIGPGYVNPPHYIALGQTPTTLRAPGAQAQMLTWQPGSTAKGSVKRMHVIQGGPPEAVVGPRFDTSDAANPLYAVYRTAGVVSDSRQVHGEK
jgi:hypothetical protein